MKIRKTAAQTSLIVVSSDLSHYHDYETPQQIDTAISQAIAQLQPEAVDQACGRHPILIPQLQSPPK